MTYATTYAVAIDAAFTSRVFMAIRDCGRDIINEDPGTANHANRVLLAKIVVAHTTEWSPIFSYRLAELGLLASSTDAELKTGCASVWDAMVTEVYWS